MTFSFGPPYGRQPVSLGCSLDGIAQQAVERINAVVAAGCYCHHDQDRNATLRRRMNTGVWNVYLQCSACGDALGPSLAKRHFSNWESLPLWDDNLEPVYSAARQASNDQCRAELQAKLDQQYPTQEAKLAEYRQRQADYREWCRSSPEWAAIRERVIWRARGWCEACLVEKAVTVHHVCYEFGKLPPAWHLRAACHGCHGRLHTEGDDWCAWGMAKIAVEDVT